MRVLVLPALLCAFGWLGYSVVTTRDAAPKVLAKARSMQSNAGSEAGMIGFRVVADRYPFSPQAVKARERLFRIRREALQRVSEPTEIGDLRADRTLGDRIWLPGDPYASPLTLAALTGFASLVGLFQVRSRVRGRSFFLLLLLGATVGATQISFLQKVLPPDLGEFFYSGFPWIVAGMALLAVILLAIPRRRVA